MHSFIDFEIVEKSALSGSEIYFKMCFIVFYNIGHGTLNVRLSLA